MSGISSLTGRVTATRERFAEGYYGALHGRSSTVPGIPSSGSEEEVMSSRIDRKAQDVLSLCYESRPDAPIIVEQTAKVDLIKVT